MTPAELDAANRESALALANRVINKALPGHVPGLDYGALRTNIADLILAAIQEGVAEGTGRERKRCLAAVEEAKSLGLDESLEVGIYNPEAVGYGVGFTVATVRELITKGLPCDS